ncbi:MAG: hydrogenase maturation protease [Methylacidiphilales bacterium]|nr:hydrogenase maturation protease [Candidatus Methylacidiphilales bacterium]
MHKQALIIGYGNPLRGDDGLGWEVAGRLAASITDPSVAIITAHQLMPELAEPIHEAELVIFVDASSEGDPGAWRCAEAAPSPAYAPALGHHFDVAGLLAYSESVFQTCPRALLVSVTAETFACHDALSPCVEKALPAVVRFIQSKIAEATGFGTRNSRNWTREDEKQTELSPMLL